jgi:biotin operon repressor
MAERRQAGGVMLKSEQWSQAAIAREFGVSEAAMSKRKTKLETHGRLVHSGGFSISTSRKVSFRF